MGKTSDVYFQVIRAFHLFYFPFTFQIEALIYQTPGFKSWHALRIWVTLNTYFLRFSFLTSKIRIPRTSLMGLPKDVMLPAVQVQGNQLKLGIHLQDTAGPHRLEFKAPASYPHSPLRTVWSSGVSHSESTLFFLWKPTSPFMGVPGTWALTVAPKAVTLPSWVTPPLGSDSSFSEKETGQFPQMPLSHPRREERGKAIATGDFPVTPQDSWPQIHITHCSKCQLGHQLHRKGSSLLPYFTSSPCTNQNNPELEELQPFFTLIPITEINPRHSLSLKKTQTEKSLWTLNLVVKQRCETLRCHLLRDPSQNNLKQLTPSQNNLKQLTDTLGPLSVGKEGWKSRKMYLNCLENQGRASGTVTTGNCQGGNNSHSWFLKEQVGSRKN